MITVPRANSDQIAKIRCDALHVGMPKCGSSFLQHVGFARHPEINLIWEPGPKLFFELRDEVDLPDFDLAGYFPRLRNYVDGKIADDKGKRQVVLSFEGFCGMQTTNRNDVRLAEALHRLVGNPRVIFLVREPYRVLFSLWGQYVKEGGRLGLYDFLNSPNSPTQPGNPDENIFRRVQYASYVETLHRVFGADNVGVFLFEDFLSNYQNFMCVLYEFIGVDRETIPENRIIWRGPNKRVADMFRMLNRISTSKRHEGLMSYAFFLRYRQLFERRIFPSKRWNPSRQFDTRRLVNDQMQQQIRESNRRLATIMDRDLANLGYEM